MSTNSRSTEGCLYIIATPIGNLKDITFRAIETLNQVDYLLCEDTRHTLGLLNHYNIRKHLHSYFVGNEEKRIPGIIQDLRSGKSLGLVTSAGTPCISDPGNRLVRVCHEAHIRVIPIPGPSAMTAALSVSGLAHEITVFAGFLPRSRKKINKMIRKIADYEGNIIIYESPNRLKALLGLILEHWGDIQVSIFKELTKVFECIIMDKVKNILADIDNNRFALKGEYVVIFNKNRDEIG